MEPNIKSKNKICKFFIVWLVVTIVFLVELIIEMYPHYPTDLKRWAIVLLAGPPIWLFINLVIEKFIGRPMGKALSRFKEAKIRRINIILLYTIVVPLLLALLVGVFRSIF